MRYPAQSDYSKPNFLISAKYSSSLLANKVLAVAFSKIPQCNVRNGALVFEIKAGELKKILGVKNTNFYRDINKTAKELTSRSIGYSDPDMHRFMYLAVVIKSEYDKGKFSLTFNPELTSVIKDISDRFTKLNIDIMMKFTMAHSFRLYENLKSVCYSKYQIKENRYRVDYGTEELKFLLGVANAELTAVQKFLNNSDNPDWCKAYEKSPEKKYQDWFEFKRCILEPALKEINEISDITAKYDVIKAGHGGRVTRIIFILAFKEKEKDEIVVEETPYDHDELLEKVSDLIEEPLKVKDLKAICNAGEWCFSRIQEAYSIMKQKKDVDNVVGFMIAALKEEYKNIPYHNKNSKKNNFNDFEQRQDYDMDMLEEALLANSQMSFIDSEYTYFN